MVFGSGELNGMVAGRELVVDEERVDRLDAGGSCGAGGRFNGSFDGMVK